MSQGQGRKAEMSLLNSLPNDILESVMIRVPAKDLLKNCCLVNKTWKSIIDSQTVWKEKCLKERIYSENHPIHPKDFKKYYFNHPYLRNLIRNPVAKEDMNHWNDTENGGDGFRIEEKPIGSHPLERYVPEEERKGITEPIGCWATSYGWCKKEQLIDLVKEGCEEEDLDNTPLVVNISDWYSPRFDCKVIYKLKVQFFGKNREVIAEYKTQDQQPAGRDWFKMEHSQALPPSTRYILFSHKGKDEQYWAGHYGAKLTLSSVILTFPPKN